MDHSENDKRFYVYVHKDEHGDVLYVGSGAGRRWKRNTRRTKEHSAVFDSLTKEIVLSNLSKEESLEYEIELYDKYVQSGKLLNKKRPYFVRELDHEKLSSLVYYDETSPSGLRWKIDRYVGENYLALKYPKDSVVGTRSNSGYYTVSIDKKKYLAHRVIWSIINKQNVHPTAIVDHIDNNPSNNKIENLRVVTPSQNAKNRKTLSEHPGIFWSNRDRSWVLRTSFNLKIYSKNFKPTEYRGVGIEFTKSDMLELAKEYLGIIHSGNYESARRVEIDTILKNNYHNSLSLNKMKQSNEYSISFEQVGNSARYRVKWVKDGKPTSKSFTVRKCFPHLDFEEAKQKTFELAKDFRASLSSTKS